MYLELKARRAISNPSPKITRPELADIDISWHFVPNPSR
jgi:hypothetical protein